VMLWYQLLSYPTLDHSTLHSDLNSGKINGSQTHRRERFHKLQGLIHSMFSPTLQIKPSGKHKDSQPIESLLRMLLSSSLATDTHSSSIHNSKVKNGLRVKKEVK